jgi:hypothetical protein
VATINTKPSNNFLFVTCLQCSILLCQDILMMMLAVLQFFEPFGTGMLFCELNLMFSLVFVHQ